MFRQFGALLVVAILAASGVAGAQTPPVAAAGAGDQTPSPAPAGARAQGGGPAQPTGANPVAPMAALNMVQDMLDGAVLVRARSVLQLSDAQWQAFVLKMRDLQALRRQHQHNHVQLINALNQATKPGASVDEATLTARVKALDDLETRMASDERTALAGVELGTDGVSARSVPRARGEHGAREAEPPRQSHGGARSWSGAGPGAGGQAVRPSIAYAPGGHPVGRIARLDSRGTRRSQRALARATMGSWRAGSRSGFFSSRQRP